jgi:hypothetical protein
VASETVTARRPRGGRERGVSVAVTSSVQAVSHPTRSGTLRAVITPLVRSARSVT